MTGARAREFTLVEALAALAIFGVIAVLAYRATSALSDGEARLSAEAQRWRFAFATLASNGRPLGIRFQDHGNEPASLENGAMPPSWYHL